MANTSRQNKDVALLYLHLHFPRVFLASKAEPRLPSTDAQHLVGRGVEVSGAVHGKSPLRLDDTNRLQVVLDCGTGEVASTVEDGVVDEQGPIGLNTVWQSIVGRNAMPRDS